MIDAEEVRATLTKCMAQEGESGDVVEGIVANFVLEHARLEAQREKVGGWIGQLPDPFLEDKGGGWSFLNLCDCKDGQWTGLHADQQALFVLARGLGLADCPFPAELNEALPGGMPYVVFRTEPKAHEYRGADRD